MSHGARIQGMEHGAGARRALLHCAKGGHVRVEACCAMFIWPTARSALNRPAWSTGLYATFAARRFAPRIKFSAKSAERTRARITEASAACAIERCAANARRKRDS